MTLNRPAVMGIVRAGTVGVRSLAWVGLCVGLLLATGANAVANDFCVENRLYYGPDVIDSKTLFHAGRVYDFLSAPKEVTIYDPPGKRFVIVDPHRKVKAEVTLAQIDSFSQRLKTESLSRNVPLLAFLAEPKFDETLDDSTGELKLASSWLEYRARTVRPTQPSSVRTYVDYCNWQTKLNALLRPGSFPPFARMELNLALERRSLMPTEVFVTRYGQSSAKRQVTFRAEHRLQWRLLDSDLEQIEQAGQQLASYQQIELSEYQRPLLKPASE